MQPAKNMTEQTNIRELQKKEAIARLKMIGVLPDVIQAFKDDRIMYSERVNKAFQAVLYDLKDEELKNKIKDFEKEYSALVYHVQLLHTEFGNMYSMLYVSNDVNEWELDRDDIRHNQCCANVWDGEFEEIGAIGIKRAMGGIVRTW